MSGFVSRVEELDVFRRAYRVSLEVHRASLDFPRIEQFALADQSGGRPNRSAPISPRGLADKFCRSPSSAAFW